MSPTEAKECSMTYGEAHIAEYLSMELQEGQWVKTLRIANKPVPMERETAVKYYNTKFFKYWLELLNQELPKREKLNRTYLKVRMFGHPSQTKLIKEVEDVESKGSI